jgi:hypothetical protein
MKWFRAIPVNGKGEDVSIPVQVVSRVTDGIENPSQPVIGVQETSTEVVPENPNRTYLLLVNDSDTDIYVRFTEEAEVGVGFVVASKGSYEMNKGLMNIYRGRITAIHAGTGVKNLLVTEGN